MDAILTVKERVQKGIELLNSFNSEWFNLIHLDTLELEDTHNCVVAQVTGLPFIHGLDVIGCPYNGREDYGFASNNHGKEFAELNEHWRQEIFNMKIAGARTQLV